MWSLAIFFSTLSLTLRMFIGVEVPGLEPADSQGHLPGQGQTAEVDCTALPPSGTSWRYIGSRALALRLWGWMRKCTAAFCEEPPDQV